VGVDFRAFLILEADRCD